MLYNYRDTKEDDGGAWRGVAFRRRAFIQGAAAISLCGALPIWEVAIPRPQVVQYNV